jgi:hypothetical protein
VKRLHTSTPLSQHRKNLPPLDPESVLDVTGPRSPSPPRH